VAGGKFPIYNFLSAFESVCYFCYGHYFCCVWLGIIGLTYFKASRAATESFSGSVGSNALNIVKIFSNYNHMILYGSFLPKALES
jgi:hypothetical protein